VDGGRAADPYGSAWAAAQLGACGLSRSFASISAPDGGSRTGIKEALPLLKHAEPPRRCRARHHRCQGCFLATGAQRTFFRRGNGITPVGELGRPGPLLSPDVRAFAVSPSPPRSMEGLIEGCGGRDGGAAGRGNIRFYVLWHVGLGPYSGELVTDALRHRTPHQRLPWVGLHASSVGGGASLEFTASTGYGFHSSGTSGQFSGASGSTSMSTRIR
jgi:hypothetical protein